MTTRCREVRYDTFLDVFMQVSGYSKNDLKLSRQQLAAMPHKFSGLTDEVLNSRLERNMYPHICAGLNEASDQAAQRRPSSDPKSYVFKDVSDWSEEDLKIDIAMYPKGLPAAEEAYLLDEATTNGRPDASRASWGWMTVGVEVKLDDKKAAFHFVDNGKCLRNSDEGRKAQAQLASYATQLMIRQHRTFVFILYISRRMARITRWDRTGCIVSTPIDLEQNPEKVLNVVYRLGLMNAKELGYDTTAVLATPLEVAELERMTHKNPRAADIARDILENQICYPIYKVTCPKVKDGGEGVFFIGKHASTSYSPTGRATKGYVAFDTSKKRLGFLKDYWRPNSDKVPRELDVYVKLNDEGVCNVATAIAGGDLFGQRTMTQEYLEGDRVPLERLHCRLVFEELARPLETYSNSSELILIILEALEGHEDAWNKARYLHRDISLGNILAVVDQDDEKDRSVRGILNDWDLCKHRDDLEKEATQHGRSGTWAYMSAISLKYPFKPSALADDLESFIHVVAMCALRFHLHNLSVHSVGQVLSTKDLMDLNNKNSLLSKHVADHYYESYTTIGGIHHGGIHKFTQNASGKPAFALRSKTVFRPFIQLLDTLYELLRKHYAAIDTDDLRKFLPQQLDEDETLSDEEPSSEEDEEEGFRPSRPRTVRKSEPVLRAPPPVAKGELVLDTHAAIKEAFDMAWAGCAESKKKKADKTQDQFLGLLEIVEHRPRLASAGSSKRKSLADSEYTSSMGSKRFKFVDGDAYGGGSTGSVLEDVEEADE